MQRFVVSLLILCTLQHVKGIEEAGVLKTESGNITLEIKFENPNHLLSDGLNCDVLINVCDYNFVLEYVINDRDIKFDLSTDAKHTIDWQVPLYSFYDDEFFEQDSLNVSFLAQDLDVGKNQTIGKFVFDIDFNQPKRDNFEMEKESDSPETIKASVISYKIACHDNYFGNLCQNHCDKKNPFYTCDAMGHRTCLTDFVGLHCDIFDICKHMKCAPGAKCESLRGNKRKCTCANGSTGKECYLGYDPCRDKVCAHGGKCVVDTSTIESVKCECTSDYHGESCELPISVCYSGDHMNETLVSKLEMKNAIRACDNNGRCVKRGDPIDPFYCECKSFYEGRNCETYLRVRYIIVVLLILILCVGTFIFCCIILAKVYLALIGNKNDDFKMTFIKGQDYE